MAAEGFFKAYVKIKEIVIPRMVNEYLKMA
jgi:hypothetical protein